MHKYPVFYLFALSLLFGSCLTHRNSLYFQPKHGGPTTYNIPEPPEQLIKPNDELLIYVMTDENISFTPNAPSAALGNNAAIRDYDYSVDKDGNIFFPIVGNFSVQGKTVDEASEKLKKALSSYYNHPQVRIRYKFKTITVLGEVGAPGVVSYTREQITILEALAMAGDISEYGNKKSVYLVRKKGDEITRYNINLNREDIALTDYYYMHPEDIIYVKPYRHIKWDRFSAPIALFTSTVTLVILVMDTLNNNR